MSTPTDDQDALLTKLRDLIERSGEKEDTLGSEMADDARVWSIYSKAARKHDKELLDQSNGTLDTLLIFAGLFSAVSTTFIIDSYKQMQVDYAKEAFLLQFADMSGKPYAGPSNSVDESARAINCLWISSLIASLSTALIAILAKQWLAFYPVSDRENLREWAQLRQYRFDALQRWHVPVLIAVVPALLHLSLMLFLAGLVVFLWDIDTGTMVLAFVLSTATYGLYGFATVSPVFWSSSPFRTPLTAVLQRTVHRCVDSLASAIYSMYRMAERIVCRSACLIRDSLAVVASHAGITLSSSANSTIYHLLDTSVHAVKRSVITVCSPVIHPIYRFSCMTIQIAGRVVDFVIRKVVAAVICPTNVTLYSLAICAILGFLAVHAFTRCIVELCSLAVLMIGSSFRLCYTTAQSLTRNTLHRLARGLLSRQRPSALSVDPWYTQTVFSPKVSASALSWLGLNAETSDIYYTVLYGLGDAVRGVAVADDLAPPLRTRISVQTSDLISPRASSDFQVVVTHLRAAYHLRNILLSRDVMRWISNQVKVVQYELLYDRTELRTQRDYDTLLRISTIMEEDKEKTNVYHDLTLFFGCQAGQEACKSPCSILPSTAHAIAQLYIGAKKPFGSTSFQSDVLPMLNALRSHLVASPELAAKLLKSSFADKEGEFKAEGLLGARPPHDCGSASCEAMNYLVVILARHDFKYGTRFLSIEVERSLKTQTFETFILFCREFSASESCTGFKSNLTFWLSRDDPLSQISLCGRDIASFVPYCKLLPPDTWIRMFRQLLHLDQSWCAPDSSDPGRDEGLNACLDFLNFIAGAGNLDLPALTNLLYDACLEPLQRAPQWNLYYVFVDCALVLTRAIENGLVRLDGADGENVEGLVSRLIFCKAEGGPDGTSTRTWDLVAVGSQHILALAKQSEGGSVDTLCTAFGKLRRWYADKPQWKEMGDRVKLGAGFLNDPVWKARNRGEADYIQDTIKEFCLAMDGEETLPESRSEGLQVNTASVSAVDEPGSDADTAHKVLEWQLDGAY